MGLHKLLQSRMDDDRRELNRPSVLSKDQQEFIEKQSRIEAQRKKHNWDKKYYR